MPALPSPAASPGAPPPPAATSSLLDTWWPAFAVVAFGAALGVAYVVEARQERRLQARIASLRAPAQAEEPTPRESGRTTYERVLRQGVRDLDLDFDREGLRGVNAFRKAYRNGRTYGIDPADLAMTGRYFGREVLPIRLEVRPDGRVALADGRCRYTAAKELALPGILADVVEIGPEGESLRETRAIVKLI